MAQAGGFPGFGGLGPGIRPPLSRRRAVVGENGVNEKRKNQHPCFAGPAQADCTRAPWLDVLRALGSPGNRQRTAQLGEKSGRGCQRRN